MHKSILSLLLITGLAVSPLDGLLGQLPRVKPERLGVDFVELSDGTKLFGFVLRQLENQSLEVAIARHWLQATYPELASKISAQETEDRKRIQKQLLDRIDTWIEERDPESQLVRYLRAEREFIQSQLADEADNPKALADSLFVLQTVSKDERNSVQIASPSNRRLAGLAFENEIDEVTITPASILRFKLEDLGIDLATAKFDLSDDLPATRQESSRAWAGRQALVEYQMLEPMQYQGVGSNLFRTGDGAANLQNPGDLLGLAQSMLGGSSLGLGSGGDSILSIGAELGLPEFQQYKKSKGPNSARTNSNASNGKLDWATKIIREAEAKNVRGILVFRLEQNPLSDRVAVRTSFLAMFKPGDWFELYQKTSTTSAQKQTQDKIDSLKNDPQLAATMDTLESILPGMQSQLNLALRHGAATQQAITDAREAFGQFLQQHTQSLLSDPIPTAQASNP